jgi:hypothetical protein
MVSLDDTRDIDTQIDEIPYKLNPWRECIDGQIRTDLWGYIHPSDLYNAARDAYVDCSFSLTKNGIYGGQMKYIGGDGYSRANFTDEQLDSIVEHIVTYIFTDEKDSFALEMDDVTINGVKKDNVQIFGETAVKHMKDVKDLFLFFRILTVMFAVLLVLLTVYFIQRKEEISGILFTYSLLFYAILLSLAAALCIWTLIGATANGKTLTADAFLSQFWINCHYLFFPFQPEKVQGSFFNDTLTQILTLDFFMEAVLIVVCITLAVLLAWFVFTIVSKRKTKKIE